MAIKPGTMCYIVESEAGNNGKVVQAVKIIGYGNIYDRNGFLTEGNVWEIDPPLPDYSGKIGVQCPEFQLKPMDNPGDDVVDESFAWLPPVPQLEHA